MKIKYISNILNQGKVCECNLEKSIFCEKKRRENMEIVKGMYTMVEDGNYKIVGLVQSSEGAVFFADEFQITIRDTNFDFLYRNLDGCRAEFKLLVCGKEEIRVEYEKPFSDTDVWSQEEDIDFFQWILRFSKNQEMKAKFLRIYKR